MQCRQCHQDQQPKLPWRVCNVAADGEPAVAFQTKLASGMRLVCRRSFLSCAQRSCVQMSYKSTISLMYVPLVYDATFFAATRFQMCSF